MMRLINMWRHMGSPSPDMALVAYGMIFVLLSVALFIAFGINPFSRRLKIKHITNSMLRSKRGRISGKKLTNWEKISAQIEGILRRMGKSMGYFYWLIVAAFSLGLIIGSVLFDDLYLSVATGVCALPAPYLYLLIKMSWYARKEEESLQNAMDIITNSYLSSDDIQVAFESYVQSEMRFGMKPTIFTQFVAEVLYVDPNIERALLVLTEKVHNPYFAQWIKMLMLCHNDRRLKFSLRPIIDSMTDAKHSRIEHETVMSLIWRDYFTTLALMFSVIPMFRVMNTDWYLILTETTPGKVLMTLMLIAAIVSGFVILYINRPPTAIVLKKIQRKGIRV